MRRATAKSVLSTAVCSCHAARSGVCAAESQSSSSAASESVMNSTASKHASSAATKAMRRATVRDQAGSGTATKSKRLKANRATTPDEPICIAGVTESGTTT
ncbi:hypothetical protein KRP22_000167 [Phytophthora ramorum]|uniref:uncharacterized protein n=1 Tax=Phytophthora ramorum TaxID=164328 RepID=UPI0030A6FD34|nr:hypothetical protein KRP23_7016 [Phytophthora ramorum]KAH7497993.1 hypothetical protein KRP22_12113 [Phytophthora ramorum]